VARIAEHSRALKIIYSLEIRSTGIHYRTIAYVKIRTYDTATHSCHAFNKAHRLLQTTGDLSMGALFTNDTDFIEPLFHDVLHSYFACLSQLGCAFFYQHLKSFSYIQSHQRNNKPNRLMVRFFGRSKN
jgi:hypothetical protein